MHLRSNTCPWNKGFLWSCKLEKLWAALVKWGSAARLLRTFVCQVCLQEGALVCGASRADWANEFLCQEASISVSQTWYSGVKVQGTVARAGLASGGLLHAHHFFIGQTEASREKSIARQGPSGLRIPGQDPFRLGSLLAARQHTRSRFPGPWRGVHFLSNGIFGKGFEKVTMARFCPRLCPGL